MKSLAQGMACVALLAANLVGYGTAHADNATCKLLEEANHRSMYSGGARPDVQVMQTGFNFDPFTPDILGPGAQSVTCNVVRDESVNGEAATVYHQHYQTSVGTLDSDIWVSKKTGKLLRQEMDGDIKGKGKGHDSARFKYASP